MAEKTREIKAPGFTLSIVTVIVLFMMIIVGTKGIAVIGIPGLGVDLRLMFFVAWLPAIGVSYYLRHSYKDIEKSAIDTIRSGIQPALILLVVGGMTSAWIASRRARSASLSFSVGSVFFAQSQTSPGSRWLPQLGQVRYWLMAHTSFL